MLQHIISLDAGLHPSGFKRVSGETTPSSECGYSSTGTASKSPYREQPAGPQTATSTELTAPTTSTSNREGSSSHLAFLTAPSEARQPQGPQDGPPGL